MKFAMLMAMVVLASSANAAGPAAVSCGYSADINPTDEGYSVSARRAAAEQKPSSGSPVCTVASVGYTVSARREAQMEEFDGRVEPSGDSWVPPSTATFGRYAAPKITASGSHAKKNSGVGNHYVGGTGSHAGASIDSSRKSSRYSDSSSTRTGQGGLSSHRSGGTNSHGKGSHYYGGTGHHRGK